MNEKKNLKPLHLAKTIEQLESLVPRDTSRIPDFNKLIKGAEKLFHEGLQKAADGDEELAFVYFSRFMKVFYNVVNKSSSQRHQVEQRLGAERITSEKRVHELRSSLKERYGREINVPTKHNTKVVSVVIDKNNVQDSNTGIDMTYPDGFITSYELYQLVNACVDFVIFDARPKVEYDCSNMKLEQSCNIPEDIIISGHSAHTLEKRLPENSKHIWSKRHNCAIIILLDWNSTKNTTLIKLSTLKDIITNWDPVYNDAVKIVILDGGYLHWWESYPMLCTNSTDLHNERNELLSELIDLDQIEYPSTTSIKLKSVSDVPLPLPPSFDRALKPSDYFKSSMSDSQIMENRKLHAKYQEYFDELESVREKRRLELEQLRIMQPDILSQNDKISIDSGFSTLKSQSRTSNVLDQVNATNYKNETGEISRNQQVTPTSKNKAMSPETARKLEGMRQQILLEARRKKKPTEEGDEGPQVKRQTMYSECMKTLDLQTNLFGNKFNNIQFPLKNLHFPPVEQTRKPKKLFVPGVNGLKNLGNTCFMNSIVQALSNTAPLSQYFINKDYSKVTDYGPEASDGNFSSSLGECLLALWSHDNRDPYQPHKLKKITFSHIPHFVTGCHQDAHEFLIKLIEYLHDEMKRDVTPRRNMVLTPMQAAWFGHDRGKLSPLNDWFLGQMRVTMTCNICHTTRNKYEAFFNLNVDLPAEGEVTLMGCIRNLFLPTILHGYKCPNCDHSNVTQRYRLAACPPYLIISLSRFKLFDPVKFEYTKNKIACSYPANLELSGFHYKLYAAVYHFGEMSGGHYIAICQNYADQKWYRFDDESYEQVNQSAAISETDAYLLFYQMVD